MGEQHINEEQDRRGGDESSQPRIIIEATEDPNAVQKKISM
jgi:hypothetical protein